MAFTNGQRIKIKFYLGYSQSDGNNQPLDSSITSIGEDADAQAFVEAILTKISAVETELEDLSTAGILVTDEVKFQEKAEGASTTHSALRAEGRRLCSQLSTIFGFPIAADVFGELGLASNSLADTGFWQIISTHGKC